MSEYFDSFISPLGAMEIIATDKAISSIHFVERPQAKQPNGVTAQTKQQLLEYFDGSRKQFDLPLDAHGTAFQKQVWHALTTVDYGLTCSYADIANKINNPKAVRAVGAANGKNPLTIVVPCHRVIGANGSLTGYASGTERKAWLLNHESPSLF